MNSDVKAMWVKALRSGEYQQGQNELRNADGYCCLGVLCDLYSKETGTPWEYYDGYIEFLGHDTALPGQVQGWAGCVASPVVQFPSGHVESLAFVNDSGVTFDEIATMIESYL